MANGYVDQITLPDNTAYNISPPFVIGTGSTAGTWLGQLDGLTAYYDGLMIIYKPSVAGSSTTTLNLNNIGAKTCYLNNTTKLTTHFPKNQPIILIYSADMNNGCWMASDYDYNSNTNTLWRTFRSDSNVELPIAGINASNSTSATYVVNSSIGAGSYAGMYGAIPNTTANLATINPSTGHITVPGGISADITGNSDTTSGANLTSTTNAIAYYTDTAGTFGTLASGNGALYATSSNGTLAFGTLQVEQGGTGETSFTSGELLIGNGTNAVSTRTISDRTTTGALTGVSSWSDSTNIPTVNLIKYWDGRYQTTDNKSNLAYCNKGAFNDAATYGVTNATANAALSTGTNLTTESAVYYGLVTVNNAPQTRATGIYAPTSAGTANQLLVSAGGTSAPTWLATGNGAAYATSTNGAITFGELPVQQGGTGMTTASYKNAVVIGNSTTVTSNLQTVRTNAGAFYATAQDGKPQFGTLSATLGGTGITGYTVGDILYCGVVDTLSKLSGNITTTRKFLRSVAATAGTATAPVWDTLTNADVGLDNVTNDQQLPLAGGTMTGTITTKGIKGTANIDYGSTLPDSPSEGQFFFQISNPWYELPAGGRTGQTLVKASNNDRDVVWADGGAGGGIMTPVSSTATTFYVTGSTDTQENTDPAVFDTSVYITGSVLFGAAWNDYAEYRETKETVEPGRCVVENGFDSLVLSTQRMQPGAEIVSDTFGFAIGQTEKCKTPIAISGRVLAYPCENINEFKPGLPVCSGPNGTVSIMTEDEARTYPWLIIGTVSAIPQEEIWGAKPINTKNRVWIRVR